jgi:hypothetical protein
MRLSKFSRTALWATALLSAIAILGGCQTSSDVDTTAADRSSPRGDTTVRAAAEFDRPYVAARDTEWVSNITADAERGAIPRGEQVHFNAEPTTSPWQQARRRDGRIVYVHPQDFVRP